MFIHGWVVDRSLMGSSKGRLWGPLTMQDRDGAEAGWGSHEGKMGVPPFICLQQFLNFHTGATMELEVPTAAVL